MTVPMYFPPAPFRRKDAALCAELADTAYDMYAQWIAQGKPKDDAFIWTPGGPDLRYGKPLWGTSKIFHIFRKHEPFAYVAESGDGAAFLVFRGTQSPEDWAEDLDADQKPYPLAPGYGLVHHGFLDLYKSMRAAVIGALANLSQPRSLLVTGHSLGCGLSTLSVPDILAQPGFGAPGIALTHINLASPRVGNPEFADTYDANGVPTYRVVNTCDIVPTVPLPVADKILYQHVGHCVDFTAQYGSIAGNHDCKHSYGYALAHPKDPLQKGVGSNFLHKFGTFRISQ